VGKPLQQAPISRVAVNFLLLARSEGVIVPAAALRPLAASGQSHIRLRSAFRLHGIILCRKFFQQPENDNCYNYVSGSVGSASRRHTNRFDGGCAPPSAAPAAAAGVGGKLGWYWKASCVRNDSRNLNAAITALAHSSCTTLVRVMRHHCFPVGTLHGRPAELWPGSHT
jgi:hypothetical protein